MKQEQDNFAYYPEQRNTFEFKKFFNRIILHWHWFAISISIGILAAWLYNRYMPPKYNIHSSLIVNEYESGIKSFNLSQGSSNQRNLSVFIQDHPRRLKSQKINLNTLQSLGWNISWYQKTPLYDKDLYENEPYRVILQSGKTNLMDVPVLITRISDSEYQVDVEMRKDGLNIPVKFSQKGKFGQPFENSYFGFTLEKVRGRSNSEKDVYFVINNLNNLALDYQNRLKVIFNEHIPDVMELILSESNAKRGVDYLNRLVASYIDYGLAEKNRVAENTMSFIDSQLKSVTDSLSFSENRFTNYRTRTQSIDLNQESGIVMQKRETLESERVILENRLKYLQNLRNVMNDSRQMKQVGVPSLFGISDQNLNNLVSKLSDLYSRREVLSFSVQEKAPSLILLDKEMQITHNMLLQNIDAIISTTESDLGNLNRRAGGNSSHLSLLPKTEQLLSSLKRSFDLNSELYTYLLKMRAESAITYASNQPDVKVLDSALLETSKKSSPMPIIDYLIGIILGLLAPVGIILFKDYINSSIQTKEEVEELTKLPVAGMVIRNKGKNDMVVLENPQSGITESFRLLRTNLKFMLNGDEKKVIAVQSTGAGEGKSFVSLNLASILAISNFNVLLVGVDMRMSTLHNVLKSSNDKGLSTYLSNQDHFDDVIETTPIKNLSYIPSGPVPPNPAELLENGYFERFLKEAKSRFDYIIFDSPPVSLVADGIITGRFADVNLFVIRLRYSNRELIKFLNELEIKKTLPNLALVFNDAIKENFSGGYYYNKRNKGYYVK